MHCQFLSQIFCIAGQLFRSVYGTDSLNILKFVVEKINELPVSA